MALDSDYGICRSKLANFFKNFRFSVRADAGKRLVQQRHELPLWITKPIQELLVTIRERVDYAISRLKSFEEVRSLAWRCEGCGHVKKFTRKVPAQTAPPFPLNTKAFASTESSACLRVLDLTLLGRRFFAGEAAECERYRCRRSRQFV